MTDVLPIVILITVGIATCAYVVLKGNNNKQTKPLKVPLIGDIHRSPIDKPFLNWDAWAKENGPIAKPKLFGIIPIIVLNTSEAVTELLSRRSRWYSNRPSSTTVDMVTGAEPGQSKFTLMHDYNANLQLHHRILSPSLGAVGAPRYQPIMELESQQLLVHLLATVDESENSVVSIKKLYPQFERSQSSFIMMLHYGMRISNLDDPLLHQIIDIQARVTNLFSKPKLPDFLPVLRHLPAVISPWKRFANKFFDEQSELYMKLFNHGKTSEGWNATKQTIEAAKKYDEPRRLSDIDLAFSVATSVHGGMDTSPRQILWLFVAVIQNPEFLLRAHDVLDTVIGRDRPPCFADRSKLALIDAATHELFRWRPIAPGSIPRHCVQN
ncbi:Cytochrome P450 [Fusarium albosuccineum]|uniref:Cytochrome P450 n=1 Tax=Fusarium albosuccineum TaxID=1237068 RepID=A0A8H4LFM2_9HYPO|nr:Cytochrome P450 [Fusarium albosuccineum]